MISTVDGKEPTDSQLSNSVDREQKEKKTNKSITANTSLGIENYNSVLDKN